MRLVRTNQNRQSTHRYRLWSSSSHLPQCHHLFHLPTGCMDLPDHPLNIQSSNRCPPMENLRRLNRCRMSMCRSCRCGNHVTKSHHALPERTRCFPPSRDGIELSCYWHKATRLEPLQLLKEVQQKLRCKNASFSSSLVFRIFANIGDCLRCTQCHPSSSSKAESGGQLHTRFRSP